MKILIVEDDDRKRDQVREVALDALPGASIEVARSFSSGRRAILLDGPDLVLLDMTMPTFDTTESDRGGRQRGFGGRDILEEIVRLGASTKVIIVTQYDVFGEGDDKKTLNELQSELEKAFPRLYVGTVYYHAVYTNWQRELNVLMKTAAREQ
ncbi:MAG: response regulator [Planctomycetes bacterium]|nr:response regulator [Planctomycetota bacterium]